MAPSTIIHVETADGRHEYFGSVSAIYDRFSREEVGISLAALWNFGVTEDHPYRNKLVTIRRGIVYRKKKSR